jgi:hypothetical protein
MGVALVGCASQPSTLYSSLEGFIRQHVSVAIKLLGEPTAQRVIAGDGIYRLDSPLWVGPREASELRNFGGRTIYAWYHTGVPLGCVINLYADMNGIVIGAAHRGDSQQCAH